ncbi:pancreatic secretory granule membrane major glycoprotein GP2-like [Hyperolius riggenbachi]|uniref:pancreatic secretory granule membrane major glycoprotein GP2-like n=1 Tax=Hyperolius riggenbachi TaxID=752182 RepID=UPI0035A3A171
MIALYVLVLISAFVAKGDAAYTCYGPVAATDPPLCSSCGGGTCTPDNGCSCNNDGVTTCVPTTECTTIGTNICCPSGYYWSSGNPCCTSTVICNPSCKVDETCSSISSVATCVCNTTYYSSLNTSSLSPSIVCNSSLITVSLSKCMLESLGYDSGSFTLNDNSTACTNAYPQSLNGITMETIQVLPQTGWCGNNVSTDSSKVYYSNVLHIGTVTKANSLITASPINMTFSCSYNLSMQTSLAASIRPVSNTVNLTVSGAGSVVTTMAAYWDAAYSTPIQSTDNVPIGSNVYLGVFTDFADVKTFVLRTESCYATPDNNVNNVNKVAILSGGCPANQGVSAQVQSNGQSLEDRVQFSSFAFQGQALVYITCTVRLCSTNATCTGCNAARSSDNTEATLQIPINFLDGYSSSASTAGVSWSMLIGSFLMFLSVKLF